MISLINHCSCLFTLSCSVTSIAILYIQKMNMYATIPSSVKVSLHTIIYVTFNMNPTNISHVSFTLEL